jgi:hypothetical protein
MSSPAPRRGRNRDGRPIRDYVIDTESQNACWRSWAKALPYDWLAIAQLFAVEDRMPDGWRYTGYDLTQLASLHGYRTDPPDDRLPPAPADAHHALADARWGRTVLDLLTAESC